MEITFEQDYLQLVIAVVLCFAALVGLKELYHSEKVVITYKKAYFALLYGLGLLLIALIGNSIITKRWDMDFLLAFLRLTKAGDWFFRFLLPFAYLLITIGVGSLLINFLKRKTSR